MNKVSDLYNNETRDAEKYKLAKEFMSIFEVAQNHNSFHKTNFRKDVYRCRKTYGILKEQAEKLGAGIAKTFDDALSCKAEDLKKGDTVYRKGKKCEIIDVDWREFPPVILVRLEDGREVNTEVALVSKYPAVEA